MSVPPFENAWFSFMIKSFDKFGARVYNSSGKRAHSLYHRAKPVSSTIFLIFNASWQELQNARKCFKILANAQNAKTIEFGGIRMQNLMGRIRRCAEDYNMICAGDKIAVGVSGGKDSLSLLYLLAALRRYYPVPYELQAVTIDMGLPDMDFSPVAELCAKLDVPYQIKKTEIGPIIFEYRHEKNPCSMCAKMRRGALNDVLLELGCNKIALGHHFDDAVETFLMSLLYEGRISCFEPVTYLSRTGITQIRPMLYVGEQAITHFAEKYELPVVHNVCPADKHTKRQEVKELIVSLQAQYPDLKSKIFGAMQRQPLPNWGVEPPQREKR
jgi:tRNA 2-thiocytidine biosynthesis protein TtcA